MYMYVCMNIDTYLYMHICVCMMCIFILLDVSIILGVLKFPTIRATKPLNQLSVNRGLHQNNGPIVWDRVHACLHLTHKIPSLVGYSGIVWFYACNPNILNGSLRHPLNSCLKESSIRRLFDHLTCV